MDADFKTYLFEYDYQGSTWSLEIKAASQEDAQRRLACSRRYVGELQLRIPVPTLPRWLLRLFGASNAKSSR